MNETPETWNLLLNNISVAIGNQGAIFQKIFEADGYLARAERDRIIARHSNDPNRLENYGYKVYSQHEEDGIISKIMEIIGLTTATFIEIGVEDGLECNSRLLLQNGWQGIWIDGNHEKLNSASLTFAKYLQEEKLIIKNSFITRSNINELTNKQESERLGMVSIDIDGNDYYIWEELQLSPPLVIIEYNSKFPPPAKLVQKYDERWVWNHATDDYGASLGALVDLGIRKGYRLICCSITGVNAFFIRNDLANKFGQYDSNELYHPARHHLIASQFIGSGHHPGKMIFDKI
ncbi:hypothetical protein [Acidithrix sp. C25]|uniref:hypothetical protein n=1 Tax=Acidithrix sp. C25 TaxID=1671482 RepID=UPI00191BA665|nr:hypothetical protein [Acidithrix sp. C25]CAG4933439.1 unnamed protein product [Acidithrix sp. C25]